MSNIYLNPKMSVAGRNFGTLETSLAKPWKASLMGAIFLILAAGCRTADTGRAPSPAPQTPIAQSPGPLKEEPRGGTNSLILQSGDTVQVTFPGSPSLDTIQLIRQDGRITLTGIGEFQAAGLAPSEMEKQLVKLYGSQLVTPEVIVTVKSSLFALYITGAVGKPGQLLSDRRLSPLEAVIQAGVDLTKANLKAVRIIRTHSTGEVERYKLNLKKTLDGKSEDVFVLQPLDIIYVPEKFTWF